MLRLHPLNFPDIRISQLAQCLFKCQAEPARLLEINDIKRMEEFFKLRASEYWDTHYRFGKSAGRREKKTGLNSARLLLINILAPFLFAFGSARDTSPLSIRALELLESLEGEENHETRIWGSLGIRASNAMESQALIQLKRNYCNHKRCLECRVGLKLLGRTP